MRRRRHAGGLTQQELADRSDLTSVYLGALERGQGNATLGAAGRIADALGVSLWRLLREAEEEETEGRGRHDGRE